MSKVKSKKTKESRVFNRRLNSNRFQFKNSKLSKKIMSIFLMFIIITTVLYGSIRIFSIRHVDGEAEWRESNSQPYLYVSAEN